jgi:biotin synthase
MIGSHGLRGSSGGQGYRGGGAAGRQGDADGAAVVEWGRIRAALGGVDPLEGLPPPGPYAGLAAAVLAGEAPRREAALECLQATGRRLAYLLGATFIVRERHYGRRVEICILQNARSGLCAEDCHYCSQSAVSHAEIDHYRLQSTTRLVEGARRAAASGARRFCMVVSGRGPSDGDIDRFVDAARAIRSEGDLELCISAGLMTLGQARRLRAAGVGWVNHNLNTSRRFYPTICTTHTYDERVDTLRTVKHAGLSVCSGVIIGMGETDEDLVDVAETLRSIGVASLPVNFLHPVDGTPLAGRDNITVERALAGLCLFRLFNPASDIRAAGGREYALGALQPLALYAANSIFADGYLTTPGQASTGARAMIEAMGFTVDA